MTQHVILLEEDFATSWVEARKATPYRTLLDIITLCVCFLPPTTPWLMHIKKVLGGESCATGTARKSHSLVILRPGVCVVGTLVNAQLSGILWSIVYKDLLVAQDVLGSPTDTSYRIATIHLLTNKDFKFYVFTELYL